MLRKLRKLLQPKRLSQDALCHVDRLLWHFRFRRITGTGNHDHT